MNKDVKLSNIAGVEVNTCSWRAGRPAVYSFREDETPYYVGLASNLPRRLQEHRRAGLGKLDPEYIDDPTEPFGLGLFDGFFAKTRPQVGA